MKNESIQRPEFLEDLAEALYGFEGTAPVIRMRTEISTQLGQLLPQRLFRVDISLDMFRYNDEPFNEICVLRASYPWEAAGKVLLRLQQMRPKASVRLQDIRVEAINATTESEQAEAERLARASAFRELSLEEQQAWCRRCDCRGGCDLCGTGTRKEGITENIQQ